MKSFALLALAATAKLAAAHATIQAAWINGVDQGVSINAQGYIRPAPNNSPVTDVTSSAMTCNVGNVAAAKTLKVKAGDKFEFEWHHESRNPGDQIIDPSHNGPVLTYIAPKAAGSAGNGWVKLAHAGLEGGKWAVETLRANGGRHGVTIPDLTPGEYLLRGEIIALHEGFNVAGAQFYMGCVQVEITSSGSKTLPAGVSIPGAYKASDAGVHFDIYKGNTNYPIPGPAVWDGASSGGAAPAPAPAPTTTKAPAVPTTTTPPTVPTTLQTLIRTTTAAAPPPANTQAPPPTSGGSGSVAEWAQCGGIGFTGATACKSGLVCKQWNPYYSQCVSPSIAAK